jgi:hypothetical protein
MKSSVFWDITQSNVTDAVEENVAPCRVTFATCFTLVSYLAYSSTLTKEATFSSEISVNFQLNTRPYIQEDTILHINIIFEQNYEPLNITVL